MPDAPAPIIVSKTDLPENLKDKNPARRRTNYAFNLPGKSFDVYDLGADGIVVTVPGDPAKLTAEELKEIQGVVPGAKVPATPPAAASSPVPAQAPAPAPAPAPASTPAK